MANSRNTAQSSRGRQTPARRPNTRPRKTERSEFLPAVLIAATILLLFPALMPQNEYGAIYPIQAFLSGLVGSMLWSLPLACAAACFVTFRCGDNRREMNRTLLLIAGLEVCLLSAVEGFSCASIAQNMHVDGYFNFLSFAYRARTGGGLIGALLGWPITSILSAWGALMVFLMCAFICLVSMRLVSIRGITERVSGSIHTYRENHPPREKTPPPASRPAEKQRPQSPRSAEVKLPPRAPRRNQKLYEEDISEDAIDTNAPVRIPNLSASDAVRAVKPVKAPGRGMAIPEVNTTASSHAAGSSSRRKARAKSAPAQTPAQEPSIEKIDLMEAVRNEDPEKRRADYMKNALGDHSRKRKPVLTYKLDDDDDEFTIEPDQTNIKRPEPAPTARPAQPQPTRVKPESARPRQPESEPVPARRGPQQPKPSFFDAPETPKKAEKPSDMAPFENPNTVVIQPSLSKLTPNLPSDTPYSFPPIDIMEAGSADKTDGNYDAVDMQRAETLVKTLQSFSIPVKITGISHGPAVTRFELLPAPGIKLSKISSYADDIAMNLAALSVRIEAPIPGKSAVGVEVPNVKKEIVHLRDVLESPEARKAASRLMVGLGKDNSGKYIVADLAGMPHVLIAGQTGSGKSVCINAIIISILYRATPDEVKMILIDPKMVELNVYNGIPHLLVPVVTDPKKAASALDWAVAEMTRRYKVFASRGAKNIQSYNLKLKDDEKPMPQIVLIVDELADLMMTAPRDVEEAINRLAQLARAAGIHMVIATQRPSVDIITGVIKANIPTRIAFTVASGVDSRTILDVFGAEKLLGRGDMLFLTPDRNKPMRIQGAWVSEAETQAVVDYITSMQSAEYDEDILDHMENASMSDAEKNDKAKDEEENAVDELFQVAVKYVVDAGQASISMLQRKLRVGYARAGRLIDEMAARGLVSQSEGSKSREVLITREQYLQLFGNDIDTDE